VIWAINHLPEDWRKALVLQRLGKLYSAEIGTVRYWAARACRQLAILPPPSMDLTRKATLTASALLLLLATSACAPTSSVTTGTQPPPPRFVFNQSFPSDNGNMQVTLDRELYPPHYAGLWHTHPGPGSLCVLQGTLAVEVAGQRNVVLPAGSCWTEKPGLAHRPTNQSDQQAVALFYLMAPAGQARILAAPTPAAR
jgi:mannose-6-phosphate isomerase-like protein (cupin superfamily)